MAKKKVQDDKFEQLEEALTRSEQFIEKNQKYLVNGLIIVLILVLGIFGYNKYIRQPKKQEAVRQLFEAQNYFEKDSFALALNGNGYAAGFIEVAENYGSTPAGNLAKYYAGLCYLHLNDYDNAIYYLKKFSSDDFLVSNLAKANIGDAYMQLGDYKQAAEYYKKAASTKKNEFSTPLFLMKSGLAFEKNNDYSSALKAYEELKKDFPNSQEGRDIEKYITRAQLNLKNR